jgi:S1-C subfamily serine protease
MKCLRGVPVRVRLGVPNNGDMAELADALGLGPSAARRGGSTPSIPTKNINTLYRSSQMKRVDNRFIAVFVLILILVISLLYKHSWQYSVSQADELAIPVVLAYNESQQSYSSAVHIGNGYFLTATHIISNDQKEIVLETNLKQVFVAELLWSAKEYDISLLYAKNYNDVDIGKFSIDCSPLSIGDELRFIGNPSNTKFISTWGRVSSYETSVNGMWKRIIPVDAVIIPGMSGGAAVDDQNRLRGINVGTLRAISGMTPMGPAASFTGISYIVESSDICFLMRE